MGVRLGNLTTEDLLREQSKKFGDVASLLMSKYTSFRAMAVQVLLSLIVARLSFFL